MLEHHCRRRLRHLGSGTAPATKTNQSKRGRKAEPGGLCKKLDRDHDPIVGGYMKIFRSRLLIAIHFTGLYESIWIAKGVFYKSSAFFLRKIRPSMSSAKPPRVAHKATTARRRSHIWRLRRRTRRRGTLGRQRRRPHTPHPASASAASPGPRGEARWRR